MLEMNIFGFASGCPRANSWRKEVAAEEMAEWAVLLDRLGRPARVDLRAVVTR
jgi:hypothetical protein